jgi:hypothetical protein
MRLQKWEVGAFAMRSSALGAAWNGHNSEKAGTGGVWRSTIEDLKSLWDWIANLE